MQHTTFYMLKEQAELKSCLSLLAGSC